jgi:hypothetical protein
MTNNFTILATKTSLPKKGGKAYIYALIDPETDEIRYIGRTVNAHTRYLDHLNTKTPGAKKIWIDSLLNKGLKPLVKIIEVLNYTDQRSFIREQELIKAFLNKGANLINAKGKNNKHLRKYPLKTNYFLTNRNLPLEKDVAQFKKMVDAGMDLDFIKDRFRDWVINFYDLKA